MPLSRIPSSDNEDSSLRSDDPSTSLESEHAPPLWYRSRCSKVCFIILGVLYMFPWGTVFLLFAATSTIAAIDAENPSGYYYEEGNETSPYNIHRRNGSSSPRSYQHMIEIEPKFFLHWNDPDTSKDSVAFQVVYYGTGWIALGFSHSTEGVMVGSDAIIGLPSNGKVQYYELKSKDVRGIQQKSPEAQKTVTGHFISQSSTKTVMSFTKAFNGNIDAFQFIPKGINTFLYAYGTSNELGYHSGRGMFQLDFSAYSISTNQTDAATKLGLSTTNETFTKTPPDSTKLIKAHGALATIAFLVTVPIASSAVILREATYLKQRWYCLHMGLNIFAWCSAVAAVSCAITAVSRSSRGHFTNRHEILGIIIIVALTFHIVGALCRPAQDSPENHSTCTKRRCWKRFHQCLGVLILVFGLAQVYDGMLMVQHTYDVKLNLTAFFWAFFVPWLVLVALLWTFTRSHDKVGVTTDEKRNSVLSVLSTSTSRTHTSHCFTKLSHSDKDHKSILSSKTHASHGFTSLDSFVIDNFSQNTGGSLTGDTVEEFPLTDLPLNDQPHAEAGTTTDQDINVLAKTI